MGNGPILRGGNTPEGKPSRFAPGAEVREETGMDELIVHKKRDEMPRKGHIGGTSLNVREADEHLDTVDRHALLPKVVWPDVQPSLRSRLMDHLILLTGRRKWWASAAVVQERARRLALRPAPHRPVRLRHNVNVDLRAAEGWPVYHVEPAGSGSARHHAIFLHGGAYVHEIVGSHWRFIGYLVEETITHCVVPIYPLAPRGTAKDVVPATGRMLRELIDTVGAQNVTVIGNSAGGGLSLAAAQWLRETGHPQPNALILICPGVNGTLNQCTQAEAARDVMQDVPGMIEAFRMYAGDFDVTHPFVSPLNGNFEGLAPMLIFTGTHDLYHPDIVSLANTAARAGVPVEMHVRNGLPPTTRCCRPQKGARHAASLHAQLQALPFELTVKLPLRVRASIAWAQLSWGYEQPELGLAAGRTSERHTRAFLPPELLFPNHLRDFDVIVVVPTLATELLGDEVPLVAPPDCLQFVVLPPHNGEPLAVFRLELLHRDEAGIGAGAFEHLGGHGAVIVAGLTGEP
jgi:epsilon-lactone hydrolase